MEARPQLEEPGDPAALAHEPWRRAAGCRRSPSAACSCPSRCARSDASVSPSRHLERHVAQRPEVVGARAPGQQALLERRRLLAVRSGSASRRPSTSIAGPLTAPPRSRPTCEKKTRHVRYRRRPPQARVDAGEPDRELPGRVRARASRGIGRVVERALEPEHDPRDRVQQVDPATARRRTSTSRGSCTTCPPGRRSASSRTTRGARVRSGAARRGSGRSGPRPRTSSPTVKSQERDERESDTATATSSWKPYGTRS